MTKAFFVALHDNPQFVELLSNDGDDEHYYISCKVFSITFISTVGKFPNIFLFRPSLRIAFYCKLELQTSCYTSTLQA